jgi:hypothetical protein
MDNPNTTFPGYESGALSVQEPAHGLHGGEGHRGEGIKASEAATEHGGGAHDGGGH